MLQKLSASSHPDFEISVNIFLRNLIVMLIAFISTFFSVLPRSSLNFADKFRSSLQIIPCVLVVLVSEWLEYLLVTDILFFLAMIFCLDVRIIFSLFRNEKFLEHMILFILVS